MDYCGPRGIPHSRFLGGGPKWNDLDREKALAWQTYDRCRCDGCGLVVDEGEPLHYHAEAYRCVGCEELQGLDIDPKREGNGVYKRLTPGAGEVFRRG